VKGGEVLMPALCPAMVAFAVIHAGATPVFCDVDPETHHINHVDAHDKVNKNTKAIKEMILGALDDAGGQDYLLGQATTNPVAFMGLIAKILPAEVKNQMEGGIVVHFTTGVPRE
jgi:hypothetical protein